VRNVVVLNLFFDAIYAKFLMAHTFDRRDTYYQKHLGLIDEYHHHVHAEYELRHDQYPMIQLMFVHLNEKK
jgi:hypothetical protein